MSNRKPIVFFMIHMDLIMLPGIAFLVAQAFFGLRLDIDGPDAPSPWYLAPYILFIAIVFFRLSTWALTFTPEPDQTPSAASTLRQNLLAMNTAPNIPFTITPGQRADELIMDWKYADATWFDLMRVHKLAYLTRFVIRLDEPGHTARVREYQSQFDASGGPGGGVCPSRRNGASRSTSIDKKPYSASRSKTVARFPRSATPTSSTSTKCATHYRKWWLRTVGHSKPYCCLRPG